MIVGAEVMIHLALIGIQVHLAHRADGDHEIRAALIRVSDEAANQFEGSFGTDLGHVSAAAGCLERKIDHFRAQGAQQVIQFRGMLMIGPAILIIWARHHAAQVRRDLESAQGTRHFASNGLQPNVINQNINQVTHIERTGLVLQVHPQPALH